MFQITVHEQDIGGNLIETVSGREMHAELKSERHYTDWANYWIANLQLVENVDFVVHTSVNKETGRSRIDHYFPFDIAKHIALASLTEMGRKYRQALIDLEKRVSQPQLQPAPMTMRDRIDAINGLLDIAERAGVADDHTRLLAKEAIDNSLMITAGRNPQAQLGPAPSDAFFQVEELRAMLSFSVTSKQWLAARSSIGKAIKRVIQDADARVEPKQIQKMVNGELRYVNAWPKTYMAIAIETAESLLRKRYSL